MYINRVEKAKKACRLILDEKPVAAEDILKAVEDSYEAINILETELDRMYSEGKVDGMETIVQIIFRAQKE